MFMSLSRAFARPALLSLAVLSLAGSTAAGEGVTISAPYCQGALCYILVSDDSGSGILVRARGLHRARTMALETRDDMAAGRVAGAPAACAPVPELCPAG